MSSFAIIQASGHQHRLEPGQQFTLDRQSGEAGNEVVFDQVLMLGGGARTILGQPAVAGASVTAKILRHDRGPKVRVFKKRRRKGFHKTIGHRQELTRLEVIRIEDGQHGS